MYKTQNGPVFSVNEVRTKEPDYGIRSEGINRIYKMNRIARATTLPLHLANLVNPVASFFLNLSQRPTVNVFQVEFHPLFKRKMATARYLPETSQPRLNTEAPLLP